MPTATFVLMNLDLIAVQLPAGGSAFAPVYCGTSRSPQLLGGGESTASGPADPSSDLGSVARRSGTAPARQTRACKSTIARNVAPLQSG